jgi:uncharacterized protein
MDESMSATQLIADRAILVRDLAQNVPSPCQSVCRMDAALVFCEGCWRTIDEIRRWSACDDIEKKAIWALIEQRVAATTL